MEEILKKGSSGSAVQALQRFLGLEPDGQFGPMTEKKVIAWQKAHSLTPDGVVGPKTWEALIEESRIIHDPLTIHITKSPDRKPEYLVIHYTAGTSSKTGKARAVKKIFQDREASADFVVDDTEIVQYNPDPWNYYTWAVGGKSYGNKGGRFYGKARNKNCLSIEMCSQCTGDWKTPNHSGWRFSEEVLENTVWLAKKLIRDYRISLDHVIRHYDVTGKLCPGVPGWNDEPGSTGSGEWEKLLRRIKEEGL